jgi:hypothetical protein
MVARVRSTVGLTVTFHREGREEESVKAATGERALKAALLLLAKLDELQNGDWLMVVAK